MGGTSLSEFNKNASPFVWKKEARLYRLPVKQEHVRFLPAKVLCGRGTGRFPGL